MSERDLGGARDARTLRVTRCDLFTRLDRLHERKSDTDSDARTVAHIHRVADQLCTLLERRPAGATTRCAAEDRETELMRLLLVAFPDRVARRRGTTTAGGTGYVMVGGRGLCLDPRRSAVAPTDLLLALDADPAAPGASDGVIRLACQLEPGWLQELLPHLSTYRRELLFDNERASVGVRKRVYHLDLLIAETHDAIGPDDRDAAAHLLAAAAAADPRHALGWDDACEQWCRRLDLVRHHEPRLQLPTIDEAWLREQLPDLARGCRSFADLRARPLARWLVERLPGHLRQQVQTLAPERLDVPSGRSVRLEYQVDGAPILAVKLQELFGLTQTPTVVRGRIAVVLHLLSPAGRPLQVTSDLVSFWRTAYPALRREMRGQYPRHPWPEDPLSAPPQRGVTRRRS